MNILRLIFISWTIVSVLFHDGDPSNLLSTDTTWSYVFILQQLTMSLTSVQSLTKEFCIAINKNSSDDYERQQKSTVFNFSFEAAAQ